jgi:rod shape-determining protein MreD
MPYLHVLGVTPDFVLIFAACFAVMRSQDEALVVVPIAGLLRDLATSDPLGTSLLGFAPLIFLAAIVRLRSMDSRFVPAIAVVAAGTVSHAVISILVLALTGQRIDAGDAVIRVVLPLTIVNPLFTAIVYLPVSWIPRAKRPRMSGRGPLVSPL